MTGHGIQMIKWTWTVNGCAGWAYVGKYQVGVSYGELGFSPWEWSVGCRNYHESGDAPTKEEAKARAIDALRQRVAGSDDPEDVKVLEILNSGKAVSV